jgi:hypothetical protein
MLEKVIFFMLNLIFDYIYLKTLFKFKISFKLNFGKF